MVCLGNICRSPLAEGILQRKAKELGLNWKVDSAGTNGYHNGEAPHRLSQKVARIHGIDISAQRSRKFSISDFDEFDKIYVMAGDVFDDLRRLSGKKFQPEKIDYLMNEVFPGENRDIPDPWYGGEEGYHEVFEMMERACDALVEKHVEIRNKK